MLIRTCLQKTLWKHRAETQLTCGLSAELQELFTGILRKWQTGEIKRHRAVLMPAAASSWHHRNRCYSQWEQWISHTPAFRTSEDIMCCIWLWIVGDVRLLSLLPSQCSHSPPTRFGNVLSALLPPLPLPSILDVGPAVSGFFQHGPLSASAEGGEADLLPLQVISSTVKCVWQTSTRPDFTRGRRKDALASSWLVITMLCVYSDSVGGISFIRPHHLQSPNTHAHSYDVFLCISGPGHSCLDQL